MADIILLDAGPLGMISHPRPAEEIATWYSRILGSGRGMLVPEIADYEVRRELIRARKSRGLARLDQLKSTLGYIPITTGAVLRAAEFWAAARQRGHPTSHEKTLDADAILAGQAATFTDDEVIVASTNPRHITRFVAAARWHDIE
jgi:predicted nucleic acid-binding protein